MSDGLVIVRVVQVIVPLIAALVLDSMPIFVVTLDSGVHVLSADNMLKVSFVSTSTMPQPKG
jgi:hypothetical protein